MGKKVNSVGIGGRTLPKPDFKSMLAKWPSSFVARERIGEFSGGILTPRYCANLDSKGLGPEGRVRVGRKIAYPVDLLIRWLENRTEVA